MVLNQNLSNLDKLSREMERIYAFVTDKMCSDDIDKVCDMLEKLESRLLLFKRRNCD